MLGLLWRDSFESSEKLPMHPYRVGDDSTHAHTTHTTYAHTTHTTRTTLAYKYIYDHSCFQGFGQQFFSSRPQYAILGIGIVAVTSLPSSAVFGGRLKRPSPCRIRSASSRDWVCGLRETSEKCANFCILGVIRPSNSWILLGICMQSLTEKTYIIWENMYFQIGIISKLASYFVPTTLFHGHTSKCLAYCAHRATDCCVVAFRYRILRSNTFFCSSVRGLRRTFPAQHHYTHCPC